MSGAQASPAALCLVQNKVTPSGHQGSGASSRPCLRHFCSSWTHFLFLCSEIRGGADGQQSPSQRVGARSDNRKNFQTLAPWGQDPCLVSMKMNEPAPGEQGKIPLVQPGESAGLAEGRGHLAGGRAMAEMSVLGTPWSPAGRERVKPTPWPACLLRPLTGVYALAQGASSVCLRCPLFVLLPRAIGRPTLPQAGQLCSCPGLCLGRWGVRTSGAGCVEQRGSGAGPLGLLWSHRGSPTASEDTPLCPPGQQGPHRGFSFSACEGRGRVLALG